MGKESGLRHAVLEKLAPLHAVAIESPIEPGTPDVNFTAGWIELKHLDRWPARADTVVVPRHFKPEQRLWLKRRCQVGSAWLLLRVANEWCLLWGSRAADCLGVNLDRSDLACDRTYDNRTCQRYWPIPPTSAELIRALIVQRWLQ